MAKPKLIKHFTHGADLDGIVSALVGYFYAIENGFDYEYVDCNYDDIDDKVEAFIKSTESNNAFILITDISVGSHVARLIDEKFATRAKLFDHHQTALPLNSFNWAYVNTYHGDHLTCGAELAYVKLFPNGHSDKLANIVELTRLYDTWGWKKIEEEYPLPKKMNDLLYLMGRKNFFEFAKGLEPINETYETTLNIIRKKDLAYIQAKSMKFHTKEVFGKNVAVLFAENLQGEIGEKVCLDNPQIDIVAIVNPSKEIISYRTTKDDVNVAEFAKRFGGGGHIKASGSQFYGDVAKNFIDSLLDNPLD